MIAALFVESGGCYFGLPDVDPWPVERDARLYQGPFPVVAHPPCERWGRFATGSPMKKTYALGDDSGCFSAALASVRRWGGVLEHPAHSKAWAAHGIPAPSIKGGWLQVGWQEWTCHIEQGHYGHKVRKALARGGRAINAVGSLGNHRMRASFITRHAAAGTPMSDIQALAGHRYITTTREYVQDNQERLNAAQDRLEAKLKGGA